MHKARPLTIEQRASKILNENPLIDGHNDLAILVRFMYGNHIYSDEFKKGFEEGGLAGHVDIPRLDRGKVGGSFWSVFVGCPANITDFSDENYAGSVRQTLEQLDLYRRLGLAYPKHFTPTPSYAAALSAFSSGRLISPAGIEGLHQIGNSLSTLRLYHTLGVRYATLTWNCHNAYADAAVLSTANATVAATPLHHGLSAAGRRLVTEMNRLGMLVDLSHVSADTMRDALVGGGGSSSGDGWNGSLAPPIFSHSSAHALCPHPRNVPDDVLHLVKARNSLVMVNFSPDFISCVPGDSWTGLPDLYTPNVTLHQVVRHIMHIGALIGYDHVGFGSDFDGIQTTPRGLDDVSKYPALVAALLEQGVSDRDVAKVVGRNLLRVWKEADEVAKQLQEETVPLEDEIETGWTAPRGGTEL
ncbi:uncharacterized protein BDZ99DRAFT_387054 [Mytilinidion resinicola]|uniref:Dipeptidase n=1 Tax=Mytilinidion resinicola TaxID=574789 RepID=A0A6A6YPV0_9PEZI|nr:uncharacterized protein BDZ99DRAFT_387054 [Mytilinidion resinicola]KAF2809897.1 hypothetical protein BDZ99DRAFT_387054 [Mytilinidion resinicola]